MDKPTTQERFLDAFLYCITQGNNHCTVTDVCRQAGLSRTAFYFQFENMEHLIAEAQQRYYKELGDKQKNQEEFLAYLSQHRPLVVYLCGQNRTTFLQNNISYALSWVKRELLRQGRQEQFSDLTLQILVTGGVTVLLDAILQNDLHRGWQAVLYLRKFFGLEPSSL